jgi:hypothetical protein
LWFLFNPVTSGDDTLHFQSGVVPQFFTLTGKYCRQLRRNVLRIMVKFKGTVARN